MPTHKGPAANMIAIHQNFDESAAFSTRRSTGPNTINKKLHGVSKIKMNKGKGLKSESDASPSVANFARTRRNHGPIANKTNRVLMTFHFVERGKIFLCAGSRSDIVGLLLLQKPRNSFLTIVGHASPGVRLNAFFNC